MYIHARLSCAPYFRFQGPDTAKFLKKHCTCTFEDFPVGTGKHAITCNEEGIITSHGMLFKLSEDCYDTYFMLSLAGYYKMECGEYDMEMVNLTGQKYLFQIGGPRSLELLEKVTEDDLHDIKFMRFRNTSIAGKEVRIARMGMACLYDGTYHLRLSPDFLSLCL